VPDHVAADPVKVESEVAGLGAEIDVARVSVNAVRIEPKEVTTTASVPLLLVAVTFAVIFFPASAVLRR
jgi:hypothetical protein